MRYKIIQNYFDEQQNKSANNGNSHVVLKVLLSVAEFAGAEAR
jgi:hypothetical protein